MGGVLIITRGPEQDQERRLTGSSTVIGRGGGCDIVLSDDQVSRRHAELSKTDGRWFVCDLGSANGTFVNDGQLAPNERLPLNAGDRVRFGPRTECLFNLATSPIRDGAAVEPQGARARVIVAGALVALLAAAAVVIWVWTRDRESGSTQTQAQATPPAAVITPAGGGAAVVIGTRIPAGVMPPTATPLVPAKSGGDVSGSKAAAPPTTPNAQVNPSFTLTAPAAAGAGVPGAGAAGTMAQLPLAIATAFPNAQGEQLASLLHQALQSGQVKPETAQQYLGALFPGVPVAQLPVALAGSFGGFAPPQIEHILGAIYPGQNLKLPEIGTGQSAVAFTVWENDQANIYLMNADGSGRQKLIEKASEPAFSPDGKRLAYFSWRDGGLGIRIRDMDTGKDSQVTGNHDDLYPTWAPDGNRLALWQFPNGIVTIKTDGSDRRGIAMGEFPAWSPAGDRIALKGCVGNDCGIVLIRPDGSGAVRITTNANDGQPAWSPDGRDIAFVSNRDGNWEIYAVKADGAWLRRITHDIHTDGLPAWASDGIRIAFRSDRDGKWAIYTATGIGGAPIKLADAPVRTAGNWPWTMEKLSWR
jgi:TolB protein